MKDKKQKAVEEKGFDMWGNDEIAFNHSNVYGFDKQVSVSFSIDSFQTDNNSKSNTEVSRIHIQMYFQEDAGMSGVIEDVFFTMETRDGKEHIFTVDEIEPEQLYWIGKAFLKIAKHFGISKKYFTEKITNSREG